MENIKLNPVTVLYLGAVVALGSTANVTAALVMGCTVLVVSVLSNLISAAFCKFVEESAVSVVRVLVTTCVASACGMLVNAFLPSAYSMIALYLSVLAVDVLVNKNNELTVGEVCKNCVTLLVALVVTAAIREVVGAGSICGTHLAFMDSLVIPVVGQAPGAFMIYAFVLAAFNKPAKAD